MSILGICFARSPVAKINEWLSRFFFPSCELASERACPRACADFAMNHIVFEWRLAVSGLARRKDAKSSQQRPISDFSNGLTAKSESWYASAKSARTNGFALALIKMGRRVRFGEEFNDFQPLRSHLAIYDTLFTFLRQLPIQPTL